MSDFEDTQKKIIHLALNYEELGNLFAHQSKNEYFSTKFQPIVNAIKQFHIKSEKLTAKSYEDFISKNFSSGNYAKWIDSEQPASVNMIVLAEKRIFSQICNIAVANKDDFDFYLSQLKENFVQRNAVKYFEDFDKERKSDIFKATAQLSEQLRMLSSEGDKNAIATLDASEYVPTDWIADLERRRTEIEERLLTGYPEIDHCINIGLKPGMFTLFVANVGGFKSTIMLNIALNIHRNSSKNVLFVPLEMPAKEVYNKIMSREARIDLHKIEHAEKLTDLELDRLKEASHNWKDDESKFIVLDPESRMRVSDIAKLIERDSSWFNPDVVVIDYLSIMKPEIVDEKRPTHEQIGQMIKDLRALGRKKGFTVISAAQLNREAIKRQRKEKEGQSNFGSDDVKGAHAFSEDSDNMFAQIPLPSQPSAKLQIFCIKARYGSKTFADGKTSAILNVEPALSLITSEQDATWTAQSIDSSIQHAEKIIDDFGSFDLDFDDDENVSSDSIPSASDMDNGKTKDDYDMIFDGF